MDAQQIEALVKLAKKAQGTMFKCRDSEYRQKANQIISLAISNLEATPIEAKVDQIESYRLAELSYVEFISAYLNIAEDVSTTIHGIRSDLNQLRFWKKSEFPLAVDTFMNLREDYLKAKTSLVSLRTAYPQYYRM